MKRLVIAGLAIATLLAVLGVAYAAPLPPRRVTAVQSIMLAWDNATLIPTNEWPKITTRVYKLAPGWTGDPATNAAWTLVVTVPFTQTWHTVSCGTTGTWGFAAQHVHVEAGSTNDSAFAILCWTNIPFIMGPPTFK